MISSFKIENFKGFRELELPQLSRITLLGGSNNVGKTSVLEALHIFLKRYDRQLMIFNQIRRGATVLPDNAEAVWMPNFHNFDLDVPIQLSGNVNGVQQRTEIRHIRLEPHEGKEEIVPAYRHRSNFNPTLFDDQDREILQIRYSIDGNETPSREGLLNGDIRFIAESDKIHPYAIDFLGGRREQEELAKLYSSLDIAGKQETVVKFLRVIEPNLKSLSVALNANRPMVYGDVGLSRKIPVAYMGDGMSRLLSIILHIANVENGTLLVDEIENGLHHSVMAKVWEGIAKATREFNCQIIATTHSYECLQGALTGLGKSCMDDFSYIRLDRIGDNIVPKRFDYRKMEIALEHLMEVR